MHSSNSTAYLEHTNLTVRNPDTTADLLIKLFDWKIRWSGASMDDGYTVHVGNDTSYLALYTNQALHRPEHRNHAIVNNLNHIAVVVPDLDELKTRAMAAGLEPFNFGEYQPGKRFYVLIPDGLEIEIVSYD